MGQLELISDHHTNVVTIPSRHNMLDDSEFSFKIAIGFCFQTWLAGPYDCGEARCPIPFNSKLFVEGTYTSESDLCFMVPRNNKTLKLHGLCAIPVAMVPRTPLPPVDSCPKLQPGDDDWPFPNYSWNVEGQSGQILRQVKKVLFFSSSLDY